MNSDNSTNEEIIAKGGQRGPMTQNNSESDTNASPEMPSESSNGEMGVPPEMNCDTESENCEIPEPPEGEEGMMGGPMRNFGERQAMTQDTNSSNSSAILHPAAYLGVGALSVILGILISYTCFSRFFHKKPGQTFDTRMKFIWFVIVALIIATGICLLGYFIPVWVG